MRIKLEKKANFTKSDKTKQIVYGEVYVPDERDSDGDFMTAEYIEKMAHDFMKNNRNTQISKSHKGAKDKGCVVESFIAREGDPDFKVGSWVVGVHVPDAKVWESIEKGELTGFSIEGSGELIEEVEKNDE